MFVQIFTWLCGSSGAIFNINWNGRYFQKYLKFQIFSKISEMSPIFLKSSVLNNIGNIYIYIYIYINQPYDHKITVARATVKWHICNSCIVYIVSSSFDFVSLSCYSAPLAGTELGTDVQCAEVILGYCYDLVILQPISSNSTCLQPFKQLSMNI